MNKVLLTGRLTKDPVYNSYNNGETGFTNFVLAVTRPNTKNEITDFFSCIAWKDKATFMNKYVKKGDLVAITGVLQTRQYQDKNGQNRVIIEVYVEQIDLCVGGNKNNAKQNTQSSESFGESEPEYEPPF